MSSEAQSLLTALQLFPPRGLVGEQSNAYRILLRYDRKSRHRRIKKQRRYERLAATSQFLCTRASNRSYVTRGFRRPAEYASTRSLPLNMRVDTLSGESSPYLKHYNSTHTLPSVEPVDLLQPTRLRIVLRDRDFYSGYGCYP